MSHDVDCPARNGCCPNDEYGCVLHAEPPCNCASAHQAGDCDPMCADCRAIAADCARDAYLEMTS